MARKFREAKYAAVELMRNGAKSSEKLECGLFFGICKRENYKKEEQTYIVLLNTETSIKIYDMSEFTIVTFELEDKGAKYMSLFTDDDDDQKLANALLTEFVEDMKLSGRIAENDAYGELIDIDTYVDFPENIIKVGSNLTSISMKDDTINTTAKVIDITKESKAVTLTNYNKPPALTHLKRKGRLPSKERLITMKTKVIQMATGEFEATPLPVPQYDIDCEKKPPETMDHVKRNQYYEGQWY